MKPLLYVLLLLYILKLLALSLRVAAAEPDALDDDAPDACAWVAEYDKPAVDMPCKMAATAWEVIECESRFDPMATGRLEERGWLQIAPVHQGRIERMGMTWDQMYEPAANLTVAAAIFSEQGWRPWSCQVKD